MVEKSHLLFFLLKSKALTIAFFVKLSSFFFFSRDGQFSGIIQFPENKFTVKEKPWENILNILIGCCANSNSDNATGLIIRNYDLKNHLCFCGMTDDAIKGTLILIRYEIKFDTLENIQRFLVINPLEKIILIMRTHQSKHQGQLRCDICHCINEVTLLTFLVKDELKNSGVIVTGLLLYLGKTHSQGSFIDCDNFIVFGEIFSSVLHFDNFWKSFVSQKMF